MQHRRALSIVIAVALAVGVGLFGATLTGGTKGEQTWNRKTPVVYRFDTATGVPLRESMAARSFMTSLALSHLQSVLAQSAQAAARSALEERSGSTSRTASTTPTPESYSAVTTIPSAWQATATCEEGGTDNAAYGYFGIQEWQDFDGYPSAGSAPLSVQLAWEAAHGQGPPDAPGECRGY